MPHLRLATVVVVRSEPTAADYVNIPREVEYHGLILMDTEVVANDYSDDVSKPPIIRFWFKRASNGASHFLTSDEIRSITWTEYVQ